MDPMMTSSNGNFFRVTGHLCGEFTGTRWVPCTKASDAEFDVFFDLRLNKRLSKQSWCWWFETLSRSLWRHCNATNKTEQWFNIKISSHQSMKSHCGDKLVVRSSYLHNGIPYTDKTTNAYWISPEILIHKKNKIHPTAVYIPGY